MKREKLRRALTLPAVLIFASVVAVLLPSRIFRPVRSIASSIMLWPRRAVASAVKSAGGKSTEEERLRSRIELLDRKVVQLSNEIAVRDLKIQELSRLSQMPATRGWGFITADIIGTDASVWGGTVEIDAGSDCGVVQGSGVIMDGSVFGSVVEVHRWTSRVRRVIDPGWTAAGMLLEMRARGVVRGSGLDSCKMSYVVTQKTVKPGEKVVTSGTDGIFPQGMLIGTVTKCSWHKQGLAVDLELKPTSKPHLAASVVVLKPLRDSP